jgi:hypothetical protein
MSSLLFGSTVLDPATYALVSALLFAAAVLASYLPARRAGSFGVPASRPRAVDTRNEVSELSCSIDV